MVSFKIFIALVASVVVAANAQGMFPCHGNKELFASQGCEVLTLPPGLCSACPLKDAKANGHFQNCKGIQNINAKGCRGSLQHYVNLNPCDKKRKMQVQRWNAWDRIALDYFVYAICEQCCDCIGKGKKASDYQQLSKTHQPNKPTLFTVTRGNCPAHAYYDICKIFPGLRFMKVPGSADHFDWPKACPLIQNWFYSGASKNWLTNHNAKMAPSVARFLNNVNFANQCRNENVWQKCRKLEALQKRI